MARGWGREMDLLHGQVRRSFLSEGLEHLTTDHVKGVERERRGDRGKWVFICILFQKP